MASGVYEHKRRPLIERFWEKVDKRGPDECWEWQAEKNKEGYGRISKGGLNGKRLSAHRVSWEIHNGPIPEGQCVCHHCDNPGCVNPHHLWTGSQIDNIRDRDEKGRGHQAWGEKHWRAKLTEQDVCEIRYFLAKGYTLKSLAFIYEVSRSTISDIKYGRSWGWLE